MTTKSLFVLAAMFAAAGCSAIPNPPPSQWEIDVDYIAAVESKARRFGTKIYWLEYPLRPAQQPKTELPHR